jgi:MFS family permease
VSDARTPGRGLPLSKNRLYVCWWATLLLSGTGGSITALALPLLALELTRSPATAGAIVGMRELGLLTASTWAGLVADRFRRVTVLLVANLIMAATSFGLCLALLLARHGQVTLVVLFVYPLVIGSLTCLHSAASEGLLPHIVVDEQLELAFARNMTRVQLGQLVGPLMGGALFGLSLVVPFAVDAVTFLVAAAGNVYMRAHLRAGSEGPTRAPARGSEAFDGIVYILRRAMLRWVVISVVAVNLAYAALVFVVIVRLREIGASAASIGLVTALAAAGALLGSIIVGPVFKVMPKNASLAVSVVLVAVPVSVLTVATSLAVIGLEFLLMFVNAAPLGAQLSALMTRSTPDALRGRVSAAVQGASQGMQALSPAAAGALVEVISASHVIGVVGLVMVGALCGLVLTLRGAAATITP